MDDDSLRQSHAHLHKHRRARINRSEAALSTVDRRARSRSPQRPVHVPLQRSRFAASNRTGHVTAGDRTFTVHGSNFVGVDETDRITILDAAGTRSGDADKTGTSRLRHTVSATGVTVTSTIGTVNVSGHGIMYVDNTDGALTVFGNRDVDITSADGRLRITRTSNSTAVNADGGLGVRGNGAGADETAVHVSGNYDTVVAHADGRLRVAGSGETTVYINGNLGASRSPSAIITAVFIRQ